MAVTRARRDLGVVYTPRAVSEPMVRLALAPLLARGRDPRTLRICDPSIGEGAFLVEIVRVLAEALGDGPQARLAIASSCLHGVDIDPAAVERARVAVEDFVGAPVPALREHLRTADALACAWPETRFDALVGNPPYIRQERIANKAALRAYAAYDGVADLYVYFVELAQRIADRWCLIVPNKWMTAAYGRPLRTLLTEARCIDGIVDFAGSTPLFPDADAFPCIVWGTRNGADDAPRALRLRGSVPVPEALDRARPVDRARWASGPWHIDDVEDDSLLARIAAAHPTLGRRIGTRWSRGVVTGCNRAFVIDGATRAQLLAEEPAAGILIRPFLKGRDMRRWRAPAPSKIERFVLLVDRGTSLDALPRVRTHLEAFRAELEPRPPGHTGPWRGRKPGPYRWYELQDPVTPLAASRQPRLFYQDIQTSPTCCLDDTGELVPDTTVWILPTADPFILATLCSPLYFWYARRRFPPALNGAVRPKLEYMRALPLATPTPAVHARVSALVDAQRQEPTAERDRELALLVDEAYGLSASESRLVGTCS